MANPLLTNALDLAEHTASGIWKKNIKGGIIGSLTPIFNVFINEINKI